MEDLDKIVLEPTNGQILGVSITLDDIRARIKELEGQEGDVLRGSMAKLKLALKANPEACNLLLPEEIGAMVKRIYEMTKQVVIAASIKKATSVSKKVDLSTIKEMPSDF